MKEIAVVTPVAAGPHRALVRDAVESARRFSRHFVVLDGPGEDVLVRSGGRVTVAQSSEKIGRSEARNVGLQMASAAGIEWALFLDADDVVLETAWDDLQAAPASDLYYAEHMLDSETQTWNHLPWCASVRDRLYARPGACKSVLPNVSMVVLVERANRVLFDRELNQGEHFDFFLKYMANPEATAHMLSRPIVEVRRGLSSRNDLTDPWPALSRERYEEWQSLTI